MEVNRMQNRTPVTLRRLINPTTNINKWENVNGVFQPIEVSTGFILFEEYPLFFDGTYKIGSINIIPKIGNTEYIDSEYRDKLNQKIQDHYIDYRIGFETPQLFKHHFNTLLKEVMDKYNSEYRLAWGFFAEKLPYGYFEHMEYNGSTKQIYNSDTTNKKGNVTNFDWNGGISGQNTDSKSYNYDFDTPQNLSSLNPDSPEHMSGANVTKSNNGEMYNTNGRVIYLNGKYTVINDDDHPTGKIKYDDDKTENRGYDQNEYVNRYDEKYGYNSNDFKMITEFNNELNNIDLKIINSLRDCFLYVY